MPPPHPILLALETSQRTGGVAVRDPQGRAHAEPLSQSLRHDDELLPAIDRLYTRLGLEPRQTRAVGVSIGPGGFTGLRIAVATAKMLAETLGVDLVAVPSALVAAGSYRGPGPIVVALAAKGETCWATRLRRVDGVTWSIEQDGRIVDARSIDLAGVEAVLADRYLPEKLREICNHVGLKVVTPVLDPLACLAFMTHLYTEEGRTVDPLYLKPIYPRPPEAVTNWDRRHGST